MSEDELRAFVQPDESAFDLLARTAVEPVQTGIFFLGYLRIGQLLEITGQSGTAKTEILTQARHPQREGMLLLAAQLGLLCSLVQPCNA